MNHLGGKVTGGKKLDKITSRSPGVCTGRKRTVWEKSSIRGIGGWQVIDWELPKDSPKHRLSEKTQSCHLVRQSALGGEKKWVIETRSIQTRAHDWEERWGSRHSPSKKRENKPGGKTQNRRK